jgi:protein O-GlcNAc transferase
VNNPADQVQLEIDTLFETEGRELFSRLLQSKSIQAGLPCVTESIRGRLARISSLLAHQKIGAKQGRLLTDWFNLVQSLEAPAEKHSSKRHRALLLAYIQCCFHGGRHGLVIEAMKAHHDTLDTQLTKILGQAWAREGRSLVQNRRFVDAVDAYHLSLKFEGPRAEVLSNLGGAYLLSGEVDAAEDCFRRAIRRDPKLLAARSNLLLGLHYSTKYTAAEIAREHRKQGRAWGRGVAATSAKTGRHRKEPLRIGYLSSDFRKHPVSRMVEPLLRHHDQEKFQIFCYYTAPIVDDVTQRLFSLGHHWRSVHALDDNRIAEVVRKDRCHILIDLNGHTHGNRLKVFQRSIAPVQATYLGYPDTTGLSSIQYRITDAICDREDSPSLCTERLARVKGCFLCFQPAGAAATLPKLNRGRFCFGSLNQFPKLSTETIWLWARILSAVPNTRLLLKSISLTDPRVAAKTLARFASAGINANRLILRGFSASEREHLETYDEIDLALDSFPYNGTTTTCEALSMGCPVLTLKGCTHASRVGASLLTASGLDYLVAESEDAYFQKAVAEASHGNRTPEARIRLREQVERSILCDQKAFARRFERALSEMWASAV